MRRLVSWEMARVIATWARFVGGPVFVILRSSCTWHHHRWMCSARWKASIIDRERTMAFCRLAPLVCLVVFVFIGDLPHAQSGKCMDMSIACEYLLENVIQSLYVTYAGSRYGYLSSYDQLRRIQPSLRRMKQDQSEGCTGGMRDKPLLDHCHQSLDSFNLTTYGEVLCKLEVDSLNQSVAGEWEKLKWQNLDELSIMEKLCPLYKYQVTTLLRHVSRACQNPNLFEESSHRAAIIRNSTQTCQQFFEKACKAQFNECLKYVYIFEEDDMKDSNDKKRRHQKCVTYKHAFDCLERTKSKTCTHIQEVRRMRETFDKNMSECFTSWVRCQEETNECYNTFMVTDNFPDTPTSFNLSVTSPGLSLTSPNPSDTSPSRFNTSSSLFNTSSSLSGQNAAYQAMWRRHMCPRLQLSIHCIESTSVDCMSDESLGHWIEYLYQVKTNCGGHTLQYSVCEKPVSCVAALVSAPTDCSVIRSSIQCVWEMRLRGQCFISTTSVSFPLVHRTVSDMCLAFTYYPTEYHSCVAMTACLMTSKEFDVTWDNGSINADALAERMQDPSFVCSYLKVITRCYIAQKRACNYSALFVNNMKNLFSEKLDEHCPDTDDAGDKDDGTRVVPTLLCFGLVLLTLVKHIPLQ